MPEEKKLEPAIDFTGVEEDSAVLMGKPLCHDSLTSLMGGPVVVEMVPTADQLKAVGTTGKAQETVVRKLLPNPSAVMVLMSGFLVIWKSKFSIMLISGLTAGLLCGLDIGAYRWGLLSLHGLLVIALGRCLYLQFTTKDSDDAILQRLTHQRG
jgi:hypothetical protein